MFSIGYPHLFAAGLFFLGYCFRDDLMRHRRSQDARRLFAAALGCSAFAIAWSCLHPGPSFENAFFPALSGFFAGLGCAIIGFATVVVNASRRVAIISYHACPEAQRQGARLEIAAIRKLSRRARSRQWLAIPLVLKCAGLPFVLWKDRSESAS